MHAYEVRPRKDHRGVDLISDSSRMRSTLNPDLKNEKEIHCSIAFRTPRGLATLIFCAAACFIVTGAPLAFFRAEAPTKIITVTNTNDSGSGSLRQALADANDGDTIDFAVTGTIGLTSGELLVDKSITISGPGADNLAVDGNANSRVFHIGSGQTLTISGLTITGGSASGNFPDDSGAGIYSDHATLTVSDCAITDNSAAGSGGAIYSNGQNGSATLEISNCTITGNAANKFANDGGGGIYSDGRNQGVAVVTINSSTVTDNSAQGFGGAIFSNGNSGTVNLDVTDSTISGNSAPFNGGGIVTGGEQGGNATLQISNSTISGNTTQQSGGGILNAGDFQGTATLQISNSTLSGNSADSVGGSVYNAGNAGNASLEITNSTLSGNSAGINGGGLYNEGIQNGSAAVSLVDVVLNAGASGENIYNAEGTITSLGYNLCSDDGGGFLTGPGDQINTDPLLGPLQDNGGPTSTHALLPGSPAIDAGDPGFTPPPFYDQRGLGFDRVVNSRIDIGSFEVQGPTPTPTPCTGRCTPTPRPRPTPAPRPTP